MKLVPLSNIREWLGDLASAKYLFTYLEDLGTKTALVEEEYIDKGFLIDYSKFYARSFKAPERFTSRLHFFFITFDFEDLKKTLINNDESFIKKLQKAYLGFVVVKPIRKELSIGRTILKTYSNKVGKCFYFLTPRHNISLYGIPLSISALPFQTQDRGVAACATASLWMSSYALFELFGTPLYSLAQITEIASKYPGEWRIFPLEGLSLLQMINSIRSMGLDAEIIKITPETEKITSDVIKAYIKAKLPIIACIMLRKGNSFDYHAVVISGYYCDPSQNIIKEIYIHDDQIGPYTKVMPKDSLAKWKSVWTKDYGYQEEFIKELVIPVYPKN